jgi:Zn finger protein HypA/HybF involved in hydrogenase expression
MADAIAAVCHTCQHEIEVGSLELDGDEPLLLCPLCNSMHIDVFGRADIIDLLGSEDARRV